MLTRRFLTFTMLLAAATCTASQAMAQKIGTAEKPFTIASGRFFGYLPSYRVVDTLNKQGIVTKLIEFPSATERVEAVAAGYAHASYAGLTSAVLLRARGKKVVVIASTDEKGRALVGRSDINSVKDLKGKTIGVTFSSIEQMTLLATLKQNGLDPKTDVKIVNIPTTDLPAALSGGSIDAYMGFEPWATFGVKKFGAKVLAYPYDTVLKAIDGGVVVDEDFVKDHADLVRALVAAHVEAVKYFRENPDQVIKTGVDNFKIDQDIMSTALKNVELTYALDPAPIKELAKYELDLGLMKQEEFDRIDWAKFVNTSFVQDLGK
jgi:NitT/TauT family transport system substrate-binding protein